ncbi:hypothetical protein RHGRI_037326 [Rhododendron griersonianum]|uniref:Cysteine-rich receptor-like protein kinase n=1 Tax=Rhododendron griersonianum TaxID=479676 RepID=A0AAV6HVC5_9ERIC|nr:hypothetical protein RHGRI_037326 [Rhododendron griersonianum]
MPKHKPWHNQYLRPKQHLPNKPQHPLLRSLLPLQQRIQRLLQFHRRQQPTRHHLRPLPLPRRRLCHRVSRMCRFATRNVVERCPGSKRVTIWYDECMLRYSNVSISATLDTGFQEIKYNPNTFPNGTRLSEVLGEIMDDIADRASSDDSGRKFATAEANYSLLQRVYGLAQCTPDISDSDCNTCLQNCISTFPICCNTLQGARIVVPSCYVRYETYPFYNANLSATPLPASPPPPSTTTTTSNPGNGGVSLQVITAIVVSIGVAIMLFIAGFCFLTRRAKKKNNCIKENNVGDDISAVQSYDLGTIHFATNNFSDDNKIGQGGFGPVYKGLLPNGQEVAVKRLSGTSSQGALEFKNEVVLFNFLLLLSQF